MGGPEEEAELERPCAESSATSAPKAVVPVLIDGLRRLEYRGYDSAGIAVVRDGGIEVRRSAGKLSRPRGGASRAKPVDGDVRHRPHALGDPRPPDRGERAPAPRLHRPASSWSTTGSSRTTSSSSSELQRAGPHVLSETDTEVIAHLVERARTRAMASRRRSARPSRALAGSTRWSCIVGRRARTRSSRARNGPPLVVGLGDGRELRRLRHPGDPRAHPRRGLPRRRRDGGGHAGAA